MSSRTDLLFPRDFEAFVDGELAGDRLAAVYERVQSDQKAFGEVLTFSRQRDDLRAARDALYRDPYLWAEISRALARRAPRSSAA